MYRATLAAVVALALFTLLAFGLAGCAPSSEKAATATDMRTEVRTLLENYVEAVNRADSAGVMSAFAPDTHVTLAGRGLLLQGREAIERTTGGESLMNPGQNQYDIDSLVVIPIERFHALALVEFSVDPSDQDIPTFQTTATYVLQKTRDKWQIIHVHVCPAREQ